MARDTQLPSIKMDAASLLTVFYTAVIPSSKKSLKKRTKKEKEKILFETFLWRFSKPDSCPEYNETVIKPYFAFNRQFSV